jgi:hypothetical protein
LLSHGSKDSDVESDQDGDSNESPDDPISDYMESETVSSEEDDDQDVDDPVRNDVEAETVSSEEDDDQDELHDSEETDDGSSEASYNEPEMFDLTSNSRCILEFDCDSAYFGEHSLEALITAMGTNCTFALDSLLDRWKASNGFRFGLDTTRVVEDPIYYKSFKAKKINLEALPNVKIATCNLTGLQGYTMAIYVSYLGSKFVRKSNMFRNEELAVITAGMNLVKHMLCNKTDLSSRTKLACSGIPIFESKSAERVLDCCKVNARYVLNQANMKLFASQFQDALDWLGSPEGDEMWRTEYVGMAFEEPLLEKLNFTVIKEFLDDFKHNHFFTANAAGFKEIFKEKELFIKIKASGTGLDEIYPLVEEKIENIYQILKTEIFPGANFGSTYYFFDIAATLIPNQRKDFSYFINTEKMKPNLVRFLNQR